MITEKSSLANVMDLLRDGEITEAQADEYIDGWNTGAFRFTFAERYGRRIIQLPKCGMCDKIRREHHGQMHPFTE